MAGSGRPATFGRAAMVSLWRDAARSVRRTDLAAGRRPGALQRMSEPLSSIAAIRILGNKERKGSMLNIDLLTCIIPQVRRSASQ